MKATLLSPRLREWMLFGGLLSLALVFFGVMPELAAAQSLISPDDNISAVAGATGGEGNLRTLLQTILNFFLGFLGFVCVLMVIYGGVLYITAAGNEDNATKAKTILTYTAIGIILIFISFALVNTLLGAASAPSQTLTTP